MVSLKGSGGQGPHGFWSKRAQEILFSEPPDAQNVNPSLKTNKKISGLQQFFRQEKFQTFENFKYFSNTESIGMYHVSTYSPGSIDA